MGFASIWSALFWTEQFSEVQNNWVFGQFWPETQNREKMARTSGSDLPETSQMHPEAWARHPCFNFSSKIFLNLMREYS